MSLDNAQLLGRLILNTILLTALTRDVEEAEARPVYVYVDEAAAYLGPDIEAMLDQCRIFGVHLILCHQRLGQLRDAGEGVYNAVMTGCQSKVIFGGMTAEDAREMAMDIFMGELDLEKGVERTKNPMVVGQEMEWLESESETWTESGSRTTSESSGTSEGRTTNPDTGAEQVSEGASDGASASSTESWSHSTSSGRHEALRSVYEDRYSSVHSLENVLHMATDKLVNQRPRQAIVKVPGHRSARITIDFVEPAVITERRLAKFTQRVLEKSNYTTPLDEVEREITDRTTALKKRAHEFAREVEMTRVEPPKVARKKRTRSKPVDDKE